MNKSELELRFAFDDQRQFDEYQAEQEAKPKEQEAKPKFKLQDKTPYRERNPKQEDVIKLHKPIDMVELASKIFKL